MRDNYDFSNADKNPYAKQLKKQISIDVDIDAINFFKAQAKKTGVSYRSLINSYLVDCALCNRTPQIIWQQQ